MFPYFYRGGSHILLKKSINDLPTQKIHNCRTLLFTFWPKYKNAWSSGFKTMFISYTPTDQWNKSFTSHKLSIINCVQINKQMNRLGPNLLWKLTLPQGSFEIEKLCLKKMMIFQMFINPSMFTKNTWIFKR